MSSLNKVILLGNVGKDAELKYTTGGTAVANFSLATSEKWKDADGNKQEKTEWHNITAWKKTAEIVGEYVRKGSKVLVEGKLEAQSWEKDGVKHYKTIINATNIVLLGDGKKGETVAEEPKPDETNDDGLPF